MFTEAMFVSEKLEINPNTRVLKEICYSYKVGMSELHM